MPNKPAAAKAWRQMKKHKARNDAVRTKVEIAVRLAKRALVAKSSDAAAKVAAAVRTIDRAAQKGVLKANTASRLKSRLVQTLRISKK